MVREDEDKAFMANFIAILGVLVTLAVVIFFVARFLQEPAAVDESAVLERIKPIGVVTAASAEDAAKATAQPVAQAPEVGQPVGTDGSLAKGQEIYGTVCVACHSSGVAGAPVLGDKTAWAARFEKGIEQVYQTAINGKGGMPPKGGRVDLPDDEFKAAVDYMLGQAGLGPVAQQAEAPAAPATSAAAETPASTAVPAESAQAEVATPQAATDPGLAKGEQIYSSACFTCHASGVAGAPKFGDKAAWAERVAKGVEQVYQTAISGKGGMPPKGGRVDLSDEDFKQAVDYMLNAVR